VIVSIIVDCSPCRATIIIHNDAVLLDRETVTTNPINFDGPILKLGNDDDPNPPPITAAGEGQGTKKLTMTTLAVVWQRHQRQWQQPSGC
jgi:hypothetical protein